MSPILIVQPYSKCYFLTCSKLCLHLKVARPQEVSSSQSGTLNIVLSAIEFIHCRKKKGQYILSKTCL